MRQENEYPPGTLSFDPETAWAHIHQIEKDICYLYHHLSHYPAIGNGPDYETCFNLPYWRALHLKNAYPDMAFIREGCLVMVACMAMDCIRDDDCYVRVS